MKLEYSNTGTWADAEKRTDHDAIISRIGQVFFIQDLVVKDAANYRCLAKSQEKGEICLLKGFVFVMNSKLRWTIKYGIEHFCL